MYDSESNVVIFIRTGASPVKDFTLSRIGRDAGCAVEISKVIRGVAIKDPSKTHSLTFEAVRKAWSY